MRKQIKKTSVTIALIMSLGIIGACYPQTKTPNVPSSKDMSSYVPLNNNTPIDINVY